MAQKANTETDNSVSEINETKYSIDELRKNCICLFGVSVSTFDGATCTLRGEYTIEKIKSIIKAWSEKEVKR